MLESLFCEPVIPATALGCIGFITGLSVTIEYGARLGICGAIIGTTVGVVSGLTVIQDNDPLTDTKKQ